jgi:predicted ArsR family transcriptional regulator
MVAITRSEKLNREKIIIAYCKKGFKSLNEISEALGGLNKNTIRSGYLYPLVKRGLLIRNKDAIKKNTRYKAK